MRMYPMIETFSALSDPNRLRIFEFLRMGPRPVGDIADALHLRQPQASKHLAVLKSAELVNMERRAQQRLYGLNPQGIHRLEAWVETYRCLWDARFVQLDSVIEDLESQKGNGDDTTSN
jgi:DNA-binding transcriptional ArsR family regulator